MSDVETRLTILTLTCRHCSFSDLKKSELEIALDEHLRANQSSLSKEESLSDYYKRLGVRMRSPAKRESGGITSGDEKKPRARRQTKAKEEIEATYAPRSYSPFSTPITLTRPFQGR